MPQPPPPPPREQQQDPPPRYPVTELLTPNQRDTLFTEVVNRSDSAYQAFLPIARGQPYASIPGASQRVIDANSANPLYFLKEIKMGNAVRGFPNSSDWVIWVWANQMLAQDSFNAEVTYEEDGTAFPVFVREYDIKRQLWEANPTLTVATSLTGLLSVAITAPGTGYTFASGTGTGGYTCEAVIFNGAIIDWVVTKEGAGVTSGAAITITGDGTGATATARIQPASAVLIQQKKSELDESDPRSHDYVRVIRTYATMPGPILTDTYVSGDVRGEPIITTVQKGLIGTLPPETAGLILSSETQQISTVVEQRTTRYLANLPSSQLYASWDFVSLPLLVFDIINTFFCNGSSFFSMVTNYDTEDGSSVLRKHRITDGYLATSPNLTPDLSTSSFETADLRYAGRVINFSLSNVLNDAISYDEDFQQWNSDETCFWTEAYDFTATTPSATTFAAGAWYVKDFQVSQFGVNMYKFRKIEYYSASGNPDIT